MDKEGNDAYYLQNGLYRSNGIWKQRGVATLNDRTFEHIETIEKGYKLYLKLEPLKSESLATKFFCKYRTFSGFLKVSYCAIL